MSATDAVRVWDLPVRLFHWSLVVSFVVAWLTGDEESTLHGWAGYVILGLIGFRMVWGLVGGRHARFADFVHGPAVVGRYLRGMLSLHPPRVDGHNPLGGWMIVLMLVVLLGVCWSGLEVWAEEGHGPLAGVELVAPAMANGDDDDRGRGPGGADWEAVHESLANLMLALIALHLAGVLVSSLLHRENLARAMMTGRKPRPPEPRAP